MNWIAELQTRIQRKNQVLMRKDDLLLLELSEWIRLQNRRTLILWALHLAEGTAADLAKKYPADHRPQAAASAARAWAAGDIKMPAAKRAILDCHAMAKELDSAQDIALCHAVGQACSVVHTAGHAMGYPIYELTALVWRHGAEHCQPVLEARLQAYLKELLYWQEQEAHNTYRWAPFLQK